jgi:hypothetical protein
MHEQHGSDRVIQFIRSINTTVKLGGMRRRQLASGAGAVVPVPVSPADDRLVRLTDAVICGHPVGRQDCEQIGRHG